MNYLPNNINHISRVKTLGDMEQNAKEVLKKYEDGQEALKKMDKPKSEGGYGEDYNKIYSNYQIEKTRLGKLNQQLSLSVGRMHQGQSLTMSLFGITKPKTAANIQGQWVICSDETNNPTQILFMSAPPGLQVGFHPKKDIEYSHTLPYNRASADRILKKMILDNPNARNNIFLYNIFTGEEKIPDYKKILHSGAGRFIKQGITPVEKVTEKGKPNLKKV